MKHVLVAMDFTDVSTMLVEAGKNQVQHSGGELTLLHVATAVRDLYVGYNLGTQDLLGAGMPMYFSDEGVMEVIKQELENEHRQLMSYVSDLRKHVKVNAIIRQGPVAETIIDEAAKAKSDLIVMGSHGRNPIRRVILGSTSEGVIAHSCCPVLVIPSRCVEGQDSDEEL